MKRLAILLALFTLPAVAQQPDLQRTQDALNVIVREAEVNLGRARQAEIALVDLQRQLEEAKKKASACEKSEPKGAKP